ncbi:MAG: DUF2309 domain-containing protein [Myxococcota bacterium]
MNLALRTPVRDPAELDRVVDRACARIAPTWPLDRFIAVNPLWGFVDEPLPQVSARLASLAGSRFVMPRSWYREQWEAGRFGPAHLREAIAQTGARCSEEDLVALLVSPDVASPRRALVTDVLDARRDTVHGMAWCDFVAHSLSQFCAAHFDEGQSKLGPDRTGGLFPSWRRMAEQDWSPVLLMGFQGYRAAVRRLPSNARALIHFALENLEVPEAEHESYLTSLLLRMNGWASWCAYRRWQARLAGGTDDQIVDLLALRLAWEWLLLIGIPDPETAPRWRAAISAWPALDHSAEASLALDWVLQRALEIAYQEELCRGLAKGLRAGAPIGSAGARPRSAEAASNDAQTRPAQAPSVQAAFCIDVRSEVFRRALEGASPGVETLGFAGFFGLPIEYQPLGSPEARPQLPGLLAPALRATDRAADAGLAERRGGRIDFARGWKQLRSTSISGFSFVEALGLLFAGDLIGNSLGWTRPVPHPERGGLGRAEQAGRKPRLATTVAGAEIDAEARADLAAGILRAMSLTRDYARIVALFGHGSDTVNNPHSAGLDCGACCGQTGEVNARALAALLNDSDLRSRLAARGLAIPETTHFVAGLHHTTDDAISLYDLDEVPASHRDDIEALRQALREAGRRARAERARALGLASLPEAERDRAIRARTSIWSETRPEWGLAGNAAFIVAPRERSRHLDLGGRSFLHEYRWEQDEGFGVLELIMTAPMIVTHWINFQYYASTVDNGRYGSGNKVLHNVVGGHLGVFEGNGGDLRIGLPLQSLHDGRRWVHTPLRISVFIDAPRPAIDAIIEKHALVRQLIENEWIFLFQIDAEGGGVQARRRNGWFPA